MLHYKYVGLFEVKNTFSKFLPFAGGLPGQAPGLEPAARIICHGKEDTEENEKHPADQDLPAADGFLAKESHKGDGKKEQSTVFRICKECLI